MVKLLIVILFSSKAQTWAIGRQHPHENFADKLLDLHVQPLQQPQPQQQQQQPQQQQQLILTILFTCMCNLCS